MQLAVDGDTGRATGLTAEHLAEFPDDHLIGRVQAWLSGRRNAARPNQGKGAGRWGLTASSQGTITPTSRKRSVPWRNPPG